MIRISQLNFIKEGSIPAPTRNGPNAQVFNMLIDGWKKVQKGQALQFKVEKFKKHQRYSIQKGLQKRGLKVSVVEVDKDTLAIVSAE
jgi:hypothetical protein